MECWFWYHSLPLKNEKLPFLEEWNWNLPEDEKKQIKYIIEEHKKYINFILSVSPAFFKPSLKEPIKSHLNKITDFLPPWVVFPLFDSSTIHWKMGTGESYISAYVDFQEELTDEEFALYHKVYPQPDYIEWEPYRRIKKEQNSNINDAK